MTSTALLQDAFSRIQHNVRGAVEGLSDTDLGFRPDPGGNSIAWLIWHLTRVQDDHVAEVAGAEQAWTSAGWAKRFGLPFAESATGYGHTAAEVAALDGIPGELLLGYYEAVHDRTLAYVATLTDADLPRVVDTRWDPPVTLGVRLISVIDDDIQHAGQAAYLRGMLQRRR
ncbi:DUF664 domain-containing protein [Nocardia sp. NBC_00511]|uniref:mycothiol transferase n=1 Tax=Nocardia sp. NBC_00511 TaxID=2903591 RepID=UPI0030E4F410